MLFNTKTAATGNLGHKNDVDYFQFSLKEKGSIKVDFSRPKQHQPKNVCQVKIISRKNTSPALHSKKIPGNVLESSFQEGLPAGVNKLPWNNLQKYMRSRLQSLLTTRLRREVEV